MLDRNAVLEILKRNKNVLQKNYGVTAIYLYGSFSKNRASATSDVDVLVDVPRKHKKYKSHLEMMRLLQDAFQRNVDLVYLDSLNPVIKEEIKGETIKIE